ncbi:MAG: 1-deoxy-D-xylulose-5-phosphate reductoisomerase [Bacteroidales bacterium]|nr:1-deoxy-D-xylulose-5-phosphate reductoisomerase [Bacteroidales bacterium]MBR4408978.1 1-deoxy-D-xylulose-5-phosphate reductoisomerase [Bacteroidales bacterium]
MKKRRIAILGSTGSIGTQALDVIRQHPDVFEVELLTANNSSELLIKQALEFDANNVVICNESKYAEVADALQPHGVKVFSGMDSICDLMTSDSIDMVLTALVGFSGLRPTIAAITAGKPIALANKETLVAGGSLVMDLAMTMKTPILPVDSEHSAIFQCLLCAGGNPIRKIHLTASGGPFRTWSREDIAKATFHEALKHPQWNMGDKITIDSATMMNKGFEMIEARWLFDTAPADIEVVVHPQSIIHSMVEFEDGAVIAQMGHPDMREPIQFALSFPKRLTLNNRKLDFAELGTMTFEKPDPEKFPCLGLASAAISKGGNIPCAMNAANEAANKAYRNAEIAFYDIPEIISDVMAGTTFIAKPSLDDILETDREAFARAKEIIGRK